MHLAKKKLARLFCYTKTRPQQTEFADNSVALAEKKIRSVYTSRKIKDEEKLEEKKHLSKNSRKNNTYRKLPICCLLLVLSVSYVMQIISAIHVDT